MTVQEFQEQFHLKALVYPEDRAAQPITGCYIGDLLSWSMGKVQEGDVWMTVMGNVNAIAVAVLTDAACIVLTDGASLDEEAGKRAEQQGVAVFSSPESSYRLAIRLGEQLG